MEKLLESIEERLALVPEGLRAHVQRTRATARNIAENHGIDATRCDVGAAAHDLARHWTNQALLTESRYQKLKLSDIEEKEPLLLHGPVAAFWLRNEMNCSDSELVSAVAYHTTGRPKMTPVEKVVFIADKVEPEKVARNEELEIVLRHAEDNLDLAILSYLSLRIRSLLEANKLIHPLSLDTWNAISAEKSP